VDFGEDEGDMKILDALLIDFLLILGYTLGTLQQAAACYGVLRVLFFAQLLCYAIFGTGYPVLSDRSFSVY